MNHLWDDPTILKFIGLYKNYPEIWDPENTYYKQPRIKDKAWLELSKELNIDRLELKRKMNALMATYRKLRRKELLYPDQPAPDWFAYSSLTFLENAYKPRFEYVPEVKLGHSRDMNLDIKYEDNNYTEVTDSADQASLLTSEIHMDDLEDVPSPVYVKEESRDSGHTMDVFSSYGEYIASKLRLMDKKTCATVQKAFNDILFDVDMGKYNDI